MKAILIDKKRPEAIYTESRHTNGKPLGLQPCSLHMKGIFINSMTLEVKTVDHHPLYEISCRQPLRRCRYWNGEGMSTTRHDRTR